MSCSDSLIVVSADSHVGPRLVEDLRPYCPREHLEVFDVEAVVRGAAGDPLLDRFGSDSGVPGLAARLEHWERNQSTPGHYDMHARLRDMDRDGVAVDVIYHFSQNGQPIPFLVGASLRFNARGGDQALAAVGLHVYNQWLADVCSIEPERHVGMAHLPMWDIDAAVRELEWAAAAGLRGVNFPAPTPGIRSYDDPAWDDFWSACTAHDMTLGTHSGVTDDVPTYDGPHWFSMLQLENGGWPARRGMHRMIFGGVFEKHPDLKLVLTEQNGTWWTASVAEFDSTYKTHGWMYREQVPRRPSEYMRENVFIGASFMAPFEAEQAVVDGYATNVIWGSDYPHEEGTSEPQLSDEPNMNHLAMRYCFSGVPSEYVPMMVGENGIRAYGLDAAKLREVAGRINAPTIDELAQPIDRAPERGGMYAFRTVGPWG